MKFAVVLASDLKGVIAKNNQLPWLNLSLKQEMKFFTDLTKFTPNPLFTNSVIMGRKTWETLKKPLVDRINIVISSQEKPDDLVNKVYYVKSLDDGLFLSEKLGCFQSYVIGGLSIYHQAFLHPNLGEIYWNKIEDDFSGENTLSLNLQSFQLENYGYLQDNGVDIRFNKAKIIHPEYQYLQLLNKILQQGLKDGFRQTRNAKTFSIFSEELTFDLKFGFPLLTTKKMFWKGIVEELLFFIRGQTNSKLLEEKGVNIWKGNTSKEFIESCGLPYQEGDMGEIYGYNWRHFGAKYQDCHTDYTGQGFDQLKKVIEEIKTNPTSRRILMTDFNPATAHLGVLYPCHSLILQFYVSGEKNLSVKMYQRSNDFFLGSPFNIASTSLLLAIIAKLTDKIPDKVHLTLGDCHLYENHLGAVKTQLSRIPHQFPQLKIPDFKTLEEVEKSEFKDYQIENYQCHQTIKAEMVA